MKKRLAAVTLACLLVLLALGAGFEPPRPPATGQTSLQQRDSAGVAADHIWVYGESALICAVSGDAGKLSLEGSGNQRHYTVTVGSGSLIDQGLLLWQVPPGRYHLYWDGRPLLAGELYLPEGYTLPRQGQRLHWAFGRDRQGLLTLSVRTADELPEGWYDVIVDAGHGGRDPGAKGSDRIEADLNLANARELADDLRQLGLTVALTRDTRTLPGGAEAEQNPYADGARVEIIYASHAPYLLSCHLNAGDHTESGFQIYGSVAASTAWSRAVADALRSAGAKENNSGAGLVGHGVYQRRTEGLSRLRDHYFILRETGGYALSPANYLVYHREQRQILAVGSQGLLLEFAFIDNEADLRQWLEQRQTRLAATAAACAAYWQL